MSALVPILIDFIYHVFLPPFLFVLFLILCLASFGKSLGIRRLYVKWLLKVFKFATNLANKARAEQRRQSEVQFRVGSDDTDTEDDNSPGLNGRVNGLGHVDSEENQIRNRREALKNYGKASRHNVISRKDNLVLSPDQPPMIHEEVVEEEDDNSNHSLLSTKTPSKMSSSSFQHEFQLDAIFDYVKTGVGSIIEDEVTQRFVAEDLKMWNLLTRTSMNFEFINIKLTVIWILGFFVRYCILLPGRMCILLVGITYLMAISLVLGLIPDHLSKLRMIMYNWGAKTCFRILSRSFSAVIQFHNQEYRPKPDGICVANHTTPIDAVILSNDMSYALFLFLAVGMKFVGILSEGEAKRRLYYQVYTVGFQILGGSLSAVVTYHNPDNKPKGGICVANHTSPIDVLILACDNAYALIGQLHGGVIGSFQRVLSRSSSHIWFERSESKDRDMVINRLKDHVEDPNKLPILIFPEGTCINNTSVMQFKKGSFEVGGTIYPVAIKYDPIFGDAFWNSSQNGMASYIYLMMTSWAIVCDVWYLPPMTRSEDENAVSFANRVKAEIARQGGLVDLMWDGNLKRNEVKSEWKAMQQEAFSHTLKVE